MAILNLQWNFRWKNNIVKNIINKSRVLQGIKPMICHHNLRVLKFKNWTRHVWTVVLLVPLKRKMVLENIILFVAFILIGQKLNGPAQISPRLAPGRTSWSRCRCRGWERKKRCIKKRNQTDWKFFQILKFQSVCLTNI